MASSAGQVGDFYHFTVAAFRQAYDDDFATLTREVYAAADDCVRDLRKAVGEYSQLEDLHGREAEHYEKGWKAYKHKPTEGHVEAVVANANSPQLTHLIENGHELFVYGNDTGRRTKARPHIREAYERVRGERFGD